MPESKHTRRDMMLYINPAKRATARRATRTRTLATPLEDVEAADVGEAVVREAGEVAEPTTPLPTTVPVPLLRTVPVPVPVTPDCVSVPPEALVGRAAVPELWVAMPVEPVAVPVVAGMLELVVTGAMVNGDD